MYSDGDQERLRLFRIYSTNLANYVPQLVGLFACPICGRFFREADVLHGPGLKLDMGHVFPEEVGGNQVVLECCECNGRLNREGDNELIKLYKQWDAMRPDREGQPIRGYIVMPSGRVGVDVSSSGFHAHERIAHPVAFREAVEALRECRVMKIAMPQICPKKINAASLHTAHLLFFREFGYGYLGTSGGNYVRELLVNASLLMEEAFLSVEVPQHEPVDPAIIFRIGVCTMPAGEKCLFAALPVADPKSLCQFVFLPDPWDRDQSMFKRLFARSDTWIHKMSFRTVDRRIWQQLVAPEYDNALALAWNGWKGHNIDMTKLMWAIRAEAQDKAERRIDAKPIAERFGIDSSLSDYIASLAKRGFLERAPRRDRPYLVRLTEKALAARTDRGNASRGQVRETSNTPMAEPQSGVDHHDAQ